MSRNSIIHRIQKSEKDSGILNVLTQKQETPIEIYRKTLSRHHKVIQNNVYAQELEKKYNKFRYKTLNRSKQTPTPSKAFQQWPIDSIIFTSVLRSRLNTVLKSTTPKSVTRPNTKSNPKRPIKFKRIAKPKDFYEFASIESL